MLYRALSTERCGQFGRKSPAPSTRIKEGPTHCCQEAAAGDWLNSPKRTRDFRLRSSDSPSSRGEKVGLRITTREQRPVRFFNSANCSCGHSPPNTKVADGI